MKIKNLKIKNNIIAIALVSTLTTSVVGCSVGRAQDISPQYLLANINSSTTTGTYNYNDDLDIVITRDSVYFIEHEHDDDFKHNTDINLFEIEGKGTTTANLNYRLGPNTKYKQIDTLKKDTEVEILGITDNNWYIIKVDDKLGFASGEYIKYTPNNNMTETGEEIDKYIYTTTNLNFRTGPSTNDSRITTIGKDTRLEYLDKTDDNWFMVKYNGTVGYVFGDYITEKDPYSNYRDDFIKVIYATKDVILRSEANNESDNLYEISKKEACEVLEEDNGWYKVRCNNQIGYIPQSLTETLTGVFVVVDISAQTLTLYENNKILLEVDITSGTKNKYDTPYGLYSIQSKQTNRYLTGPGYRSYVNYWMPFYYGYGIHDASWRKLFGSDYYMKNGSHGCVNVPPEKTEQIYDTIEVGTKVLVHK